MKHLQAEAEVVPRSLVEIEIEAVKRPKPKQVQDM